ncbi:MAG TPA: hypothetical protein VGI70_08870 [Polyangiales bacterium]
MSRGVTFAASLALAGALAAGAFAQQAESFAKPQPSLAQLLGTSTAPHDESERFADLLSQLDKRPLHRYASLALDQARAALSSLSSLRASRAPAAAIERRKQLIWTALLLADRLIARAEAEAALHTLALRAREAEADADRAERERGAASSAVGGTTP